MLLFGSRIVAALAVALAVAACGAARGGAVQAPVELSIPPLGSAAAVDIVSSGERSGGECTLQLVATRIEKSSPGCYLDEHISKGPGVLRYPCNGEGTAEADFGPDHYTGSVARGELELEHSTELDWEDGCRWGTHALIQGNVLAAGEAVLRPLTWRYFDRVVSGSDCSGLCVAKASIDVTSLRAQPGRPLPQHETEDDED
jgi:hypothetical protein